MKNLSLVVALAALAVLAAGGRSAQAALTDGLTAYWPFEDNSTGAGGILDVSGNNRHGTLQGALTEVPGMVGTALSFNGTDNEIPIDQAPESDFDFAHHSWSFQAWVTLGPDPRQLQVVIAKGEGNAWRIHGKGTLGQNGDLRFNMGQGDTFVNVDVTGGEWYHLVGVHDFGVDTKIYIDGIHTNTAGGHNPEDFNDRFMIIGDNPDANNRNWKGNMDEVAIWDRALSPAEVAVLWNNGAGISIGGPVIPEPTSFVLVLIGLLGLGSFGWRRRRK